MQIKQHDWCILMVVARERHRIEQLCKESKITTGEYAEQIAPWNMVEYHILNNDFERRQRGEKV
jgi:hypothetical protein